MSTEEKEIVEKLQKAIPNMSDFDKGYILGKAEELERRKKEAEYECKEA